MEDMIEVTGADLTKLIKEAYALSRPQGLGVFHAKEGELPDEDVQRLIERERPDGHVAASMDYVHGRACKMTVFRQGEKLFLRSGWFDHSPDQLKELLRRIGKPELVDHVQEWR